MVMERRVSKLEGAYEQVDERLRSMEGHLEAMRAENARRFEKMQADMARQFKEQGDRFEKQIKEQGDRFEKLLKAQSDKIEKMRAENTQRIDQQNRMILTGMAIILSAGGLALGLGLAFG